MAWPTRRPSMMSPTTVSVVTVGGSPSASTVSGYPAGSRSGWLAVDRENPDPRVDGVGGDDPEYAAVAPDRTQHLGRAPLAGDREDAHPPARLVDPRPARAAVGQHAAGRGERDVGDRPGGVHDEGERHLARSAGRAGRRSGWDSDVGARLGVRVSTGDGDAGEDGAGSVASGAPVQPASSSASTAIGGRRRIGGMRSSLPGWPKSAEQLLGGAQVGNSDGRRPDDIQQVETGGHPLEEPHSQIRVASTAAPLGERGRR